MLTCDIKFQNAHQLDPEIPIIGIHPKEIIEMFTKKIIRDIGNGLPPALYVIAKKTLTTKISRVLIKYITVHHII